MALIDKNKFLEAAENEYKDVYIKELGGEVRIQALSIEDQIKFEEQTANNKSHSELVYSLIVNCCIDEEGNKLFEEADIDTIKKKSAHVVIKLFQEILKINQLQEDEIDRLAKN